MSARLKTSRSARIFTIFVSLAFTASQGAYAMDADLSSSQGTVPAGTLPAFKPVSIMVGGHVQNVSASSMLTPAEVMAVMQVLSAGRQSLVVGSSGAAVGGHFMVNSDLGSLVVPKGVAGYDRLTNLNVARDLTNMGALYAVPANLSVNTATISAQNIFNLSSGLISTILPKNAPFVGREVLNLRLNIGSGTLINEGIIESSGSININAPSSATNVNVLANGGTFRALNGDINIRDASYNGAANINILGGDFLSRNLNLYSGTGAIEAVAGQITGNLNSIAAVEHFAANTENLVLHNNCITGDPTFVNTGGNIVISGVNTFSEAVAILASGNISADGTGAIVAHGFNVTLGAGLGLSITGTGGTNVASTTVSGATGASILSGGSTVTANFATGTGGNIDLTASSASTVIDTTATSGNNSGGSVTLAALGAGTTLGTIKLNGAVSTYGSGTGAGGNVFVYAGATPASATTTISLGSVTTGGAGPAGSSSANGTVNVYTAQPASTSGNTVTFNSSGTPTTNAITHAASLSSNANISLGAINTSGAGGQGGGAFPSGAGSAGGNAGIITIQGGNAVSGSSLQAFGGGGGGGGAGLAGGAGGSGAAIAVTAGTGGISLSGVVNSSGGGGGGGSFGGGGAGAGGAAGSINMSSTGSIALSSIVLAAGGGNGAASASFTGGAGGGSFGGAGGGGAGCLSPLGSAAGSGGSGTFGGGGGGGGVVAAGGGGGGFSGSGGGGAGDPNSTGGGGGGGGGTGSSSGGGFPGSGIGGTGGTGAGAGGSSTGPFTMGGNGGAGGTGTGNGNGGGTTGGGAGGASGITNSSFGTGANRAGTGGAGAAVTLAGTSVAVTGTISSGTFAGQSINAQGSSGSVALTSSSGNIGAMTIAAPTISADATSGNVGSSAANPVNVSNSGSGVSLKATATGAAQGNVWITDNSSSAENITLNNTITATSGAVSVTLKNNNGSILVSTSGNTAISAPTVSVTATNGNVAADSGGSTAMLINSGGTSGLSLFTQATGASKGVVNVSDANSENVTLNNSTTTPNAANSLTLSAVNNIAAASTGSTGISSPAISLISTSGNIGSTGTALIASSGASGTKQLTLTAEATSAAVNTGNINISDPDSDVGGSPALLLGVTTAGSGINAASGSGTTKISTTGGGIGVNGASTATSSITLTAQNSITQISGSLETPTLSLTSTTGNIGTAPGTTTTNGAIVIGCTQCTLPGYASQGIMNVTANATTNASGAGNIYFFNQTSLRLQVGNSAAGDNSAVPVDSSTGNMVIGSNGGVAINGTLSGSTSVALNAGINVVQLSGSVNSPIIGLVAATGRIGDSLSPIAVSKGPAFVPQLQLTASAPTNSNNAGSIYIKDTDTGSSALLLTSISAGSGTPIDSTTGVVEISTTNSGIEVNGPVSGKTSVTIDSSGDIFGFGVISAPAISLTVASGNIGGDSSFTTALSVNSGGTSGLSISAQAGIINLADQVSEPVLIDNTIVNNATTSYTLLANGSIGAKITGANAIASGVISVTALGGDIGASGAPLRMTFGGTNILLYAKATSVSGSGGSVYLSDASNGDAITLDNQTSPLSADTSFFLSGALSDFAAATSNYAVSSPSITLQANSGSITSDGTPGGSPIIINSGNSSGLLLEVKAGGTAKLSDPDTEPVTLKSNNIQAGTFSLVANGNIQTNASGTWAIAANDISLTALGGNISEDGTASGAPLGVVSASGFGVSLFASATTVNGSGGTVRLQDTVLSEMVSLQNSSSSLNADVHFELTSLDSIIVSIAGNTALSSPSISLISLNGDVAANAGATSALLFNSGGTSGVTLYASGDQVLLQDTKNEPVTLDNSNGALSVGTDFTLNSVGSIDTNTAGTIAVAAPNISLITAGGGIGTSSNFFIVNTNSDLTIDAQDATNGNVYLQSVGTTLTFSSVDVGNTLSLKFDGNALLSSLTGLNAPNFVLTTLNNGNITLDVANFNATQSVSLNAAGGIIGNATFTSPSISLVAALGDIGSSINPILISNGNATVNVFASAQAGSVFLQNLNTGNVSLNNSTSMLRAGTTFRLITFGDITASNSGPALGAPIIALTSIGGNIGASGNGLSVSSGTAGTQLSLSVSAASPVPGEGNAYITDADADGASQTAMLLTAGTAGTGSPVINTTGNLQVITTNGGITVSGTVAGATSVDLQAKTNLFSNNGVVTAPTVSLTATTGSITPITASNPLQFNATNLNISAPNFANGVVSLTSTGPSFNLASATAGNSLTITGPATINITGGMVVQGSLSLSSTAGDINVLSPFSVFQNLSLDADGTITTGAGVNMNAKSQFLTAGTAIINAGNILGITPGSISLTTPLLTNNGTLTANFGSLQIQPGTATDFVIRGSGTMSADRITIANTNSSGTITFDALAAQNVINGDVSIFAPLGTITGNATGNLTAVGMLTLTANVLVTSGPDNFTTTRNTVINFPANSFSNGTIVNTNGDVVLGPKTIVNANGKNIAILASGDVIASGLTQINLSNSKGNGGSLTVIAGYQILPGSTPQNVDTSTLFTINTPSTTGGNIDMPKVSINTSSSNGAGKPNTGGTVVMMAGGGSKSAGNVVVGGLNSSSTNGYAGDIYLLGNGGVYVNGNIKASGKLGAGNVLIEATIQNLSRPLLVEDGYLENPPLTVSPDSPGAAINVKGTITTSSSSGLGGAVSLSSSSHAVVTGNVNTSGLLGGGSFNIGARESISVANVTTSALTTSSSSAAGNGGGITIAGSAVKAGTLLALGGTNKGTGNGGNGGSVFLRADPDTSGVPLGGIAIKGFINTAGGTSKLGNGGNGGSVVVFAATLSVTGTTGGASINAKGVTAGTVNIQTFATQKIPDNFDLTSTKRSIPALPGGIFTFGTPNPVNGVAGTIVSDATVSKATVGNNGQIDASIFPSSKITVQITPLSSFTIQEGTSTLTIQPALTLGGPRVMLTPAEALAAYQHISAGTQTITLSQPADTKSGAFATGTTVPVVLLQLDVRNNSFTSFKVPSGVGLSFEGSTPMITVPSKNLLAGDISFDSGATAYINFGSVAFKNTGSIVALNSTLIFSGTAGSWTNNGTIEAGELLIARPSKGALTFTTGAGAHTLESNNNIVMDSSFDSAINVSFKALGADRHTQNFAFAPFAMPTAYTANVIANATAASTQPTVSMKFALARDTGSAIVNIDSQITGALSAKSVTLSAPTFKFSGTTLTPTVTLVTGNITSMKTVSITAGDTVGIISSTISAGSTSEVFNPTGTIDRSQISSFGSILLTSNTAGLGTGISISGSTLTAVGGNVQLKTTSTSSSSITFQTNNKLTALGGNILVLSKGSLLGPSVPQQNEFKAEGITGTASGGIEFSAGSTTSRLSSAFSKPANTQPGDLTVLGTGITAANVSNNGGVILANPATSSSINLFATGSAPQLTLNHGAMLFSTTGNAVINLSGATYTTSSSKPVAFAESANVDEVVVDTEFDY